MPLGNLTSQFFANVYLNELDQFVKHKLRAKYYIRYVDDFIILHSSRKTLEEHKAKINDFLNTKLKLELHPDKCRILKLSKGVGFLGFRIFFFHKLVKKKNPIKFEKRFEELKAMYKDGFIERDKAAECFEGWLAYISHANTYKYRRHLTRLFNKCFPLQAETKIGNIKKHENFVKKIKKSYLQYSPQKTLELFKKGLSIKEIADKRGIKEGTVWDHFAKLIEHNQFSVWKILPKEKILLILPKIYSENDKLKEIRERVNGSATFDEINCILAFVKFKNKKRNIAQLSSWYQKNYCLRKCYLNKDQRKACKFKFDILCSGNSAWELTRKEFLNLFNNYLQICVLPEPDKKKYITWNEFKSRFR